MENNGGFPHVESEPETSLIFSLKQLLQRKTMAVFLILNPNQKLSFKKRFFTAFLRYLMLGKI